ncbi:methionine--tRNA ligase, mitochondrial-like isoform X2 [Amphibalanus amphitrite]|uniref:methionine--tRNA ligase, mitochondrial-like isoform X2 n=1 Tax=Amphibalanus amphitrite TaxID=1232801 RepID=UPI001C90F32F|nr:methionine--tRNA ligase, mitochondrial-like isoform X2 [Amphibalanus amphitrite]
MSRCWIKIIVFNDPPHLGHLYSAVLADAAGRYAALRHGRPVLLSTGTDEHGLKVRQAAAAAGSSPARLSAAVSAQYRTVFDTACVQYTRFIRTTEPEHRRAVQHFWNLLDSRGYIQKGSYAGWYSIPDESFLTPTQVTEEVRGGQKVTVSLESGHQVTWAEEDNYLFPMSRLRDDLRYWVRNHVTVRPAKFGRLLESWLDAELPDLSVSRPVSRLDWGVPVPGDDQQVVYVWLDALVNYLTVSGYPDQQERWPPDCQLFGKDILKFHGVYWPALLLAAGLEPPRHLFCHSHWTVDGAKMSKSLGNVVSAQEALETYSADGARYFLLREGVPHSDGNFSRRKAALLLNAELADTLGNLLGRCSGATVNPEQRRRPAAAVGPGAEGQDLLEEAARLPAAVAAEYDELCFYRGLEEIQAVLRSTNQFVQQQEPWVLRRQPESRDQLHACLAVSMEVLRVAGILLQPVVPALAGRLLDKLGVLPDERSWQHAERLADEDRPLGTGSAVLFKKLR